MDSREVNAKELERRRKISEAKRGKPRPDVAERNKSEKMRSAPRVMSEEALARLVETRTTHGQARSRSGGRKASPTYYIWAAMIQRCTNVKNRHYDYYGGRGIQVCDRWRDFANFLADMGERPEGLSIDRTDNDGNYEPGNCRWATRVEQEANKRLIGTSACDVCGKPTKSVTRVCQRTIECERERTRRRRLPASAWGEVGRPEWKGDD